MSKLRIGIIFGGNSKEREVSFAGGRTVYDNLDKNLFEAVPIFVDSFGNFVLLNWHFIYKGSIRDFYPPVSALPANQEFQLYAESLGNLSLKAQKELSASLGQNLEFSDLKDLIDLAFLCLHGTNGEDGRIQGLLEYLNIPYTGSGILSSAIGVNKAVQKQFQIAAGFKSPAFFSLSRDSWKADSTQIIAKIVAEIGFPCVIKSANQGSSIGVSIIKENNTQQIADAIDKAFFIKKLNKQSWTSLDKSEKFAFVRNVSDIREGIALPMQLKQDQNVENIYQPEILFQRIEECFSNSNHNIELNAFDGDSEIIVEAFINGREFSCIVIENEHGEAIALPPTEIRKGGDFYDYRSKYLPGLSRKITPIDLSAAHINTIRSECERLYKALKFNVYARIDGFINAQGEVFLNDPNTTSGMMPSSFFFHQAAEIGLNPSQFLSFIIRTSLKARISDFKNYHHLPALLQKLDSAIEANSKNASDKKNVAVIFGGYSSERHISVESGRNIYEKLSSSTKYLPIPIFLSGNAAEYQLFRIPINLLLKDNADDIKDKIAHWHIHPVVQEIIEKCTSITKKYASLSNSGAPQMWSFDDLKQKADIAFIALHGRPGEDGQLQAELDNRQIPYNGSGVQSSQLTINKYQTNEVLLQNGLHAAKHQLFYKKDWQQQQTDFVQAIEQLFKYPFIVKPVDDGCSSAVKKIKNQSELSAFCSLIFRDTDELDPPSSKLLQIREKEEFPQKEQILVEELIGKNSAQHFLEITGGLLTHINPQGEIEYEMFEASETLSEGDILSLEEKFLAGQGQNITPARYAPDPVTRKKISDKVKEELKKAAKLAKVEGYCRIDAFVRIYSPDEVEVLIIEINSLPGMTPATCIFHQCAINGYKPYEFIDKILEFGIANKNRRKTAIA